MGSQSTWISLKLVKTPRSLSPKYRSTRIPLRWLSELSEFVPLTAWDRNAKLWHHNDVKCRTSIQILVTDAAVNYLNIATSTVNLLFVFDSKLDYQGFTLIRELVERGWQCVELGICAGLNAYRRRTRTNKL